MYAMGEVCPVRKEFYNSTNHQLDIYMINCGYEDCIDYFVSAPNIRNYYLIHYVTRGAGYFETEGRKVRVSAGDIFMMHPGQLVSYYSPDPKETWSFCWIGFSGSRAKDYLGLTGLTSCTKKGVGIQFYIQIMDCLKYVEENDRNISQFRLNACVMNCLMALTKDSAKRRIKPEEHAERAVSYIEYNYMKGITARDVYTYLNLDRTYFYRIMKEHTGMSPEQFIIRYKVSKSLELLRHSGYSITEIAAFVGVGDVFYFSRLFKKVMNMSPSEYRRKYEKDYHGM